MPDIKITKEFTWSMAHMLANHSGKCRNIHGHTYKMAVEVMRKEGGLIQAPGNSDHRMVLDFSQVKSIVKELIVDKYDHCFIYWAESTDPLEHDIAQVLKKYDRKIVETRYRPTAEEMAIHFKEIINTKMEPMGICVSKLTIWETPTSFATAE